MRNDPEVRQAVDRYQLGIPNSPVSGRSGELLGRGTGSSLEFQEHREYLPGDDLRHLDWAVYARSDSLTVRLYREEISPSTQVILDISRSMDTGFGPSAGIKSKVARQLASMFGVMVSALGARPSVILVGDKGLSRELGLEQLDLLNDFEMTGTTNLAAAIEQNLVPLKKGAVRIVISDWMFEHDSRSLIRRLATDSSMLWGLQLLTQFESEPEPLGGRKLVDMESREQSDLILDRTVIDRYRQRLQNLQRELQMEFRRCQGVFITCVAENGLDAICLKELCSAGILRVA